jgi:cytochrome d ubiquinol oxidase subunit I
MIACGSLLLLVMAIALIQTLRWRIDQHRWVLHMTLWSLPLPWIAIEAGWFMTEFGRQPWAIQDILPTWYAHSALSAGQLAFSMGANSHALHLVFNCRSLPDAEIRAPWRMQCITNNQRNNRDKGDNHVGL